MLEKFYGDVLPQTGYFCLWTKHNKQHLWAESQQELIELTQRNAHVPDTYFGTTSYQSFSRKAYNVQRLRSLRLDIDAGAHKIAKHPDGAYPTQRDAIAAVVAFAKATTFAPTYILSSGEGLHLYWCFGEDVKPEEWVPLAAGLQALGLAHGLKIDSTTTNDMARILRPPGTIHGDSGNTVTILKDTGAIWSPAALREKLRVAMPEPEPEIVPTRQYDTSINREAIIETVQRPPVSAYEVAKKCEALRFVAQRGGDVQEPYWRAMLGLVKHTIEGEDLAHEWSHEHPGSTGGYDGYDFDATQKKIDGWTAGPTRCAEFANHTKACESCMHRGTVRSPVMLVNPPAPVAAPAVHQVTDIMATAAAPAPAAATRLPPTKPWEGRLPPSYDVSTSPDGKTHTLFTLEKVLDENGVVETDDNDRPKMKRLEFTHNIWWLNQWAGTENEDEKARMTISLLEHGAVKTFTMEQNILASLPDFKKTLANMSIHPLPGRKESQAMLDYGIKAIQHIHLQGKRLQIADHLGLRILPDGQMVAAQGEYTIWPDGHIERSMIGGRVSKVARQFTVPLPRTGASGDWGPEVWSHITPLALQHVQFLQTHYGTPGMERLQVAIMMGLASPFMPFVEGKFMYGATLPRTGLSVSLFSRQSGAGKTTAVASAIAAYGSPQDLINDGGADGATPRARGNRLSAHGTLPHVMDEMGTNTPQAVAQAISMIANGAPRERSDVEGGLNLSSPWALMNLMTTNLSQRDMIGAVQESSDAIQQRLLEINVDDLPEFDITRRTKFVTDWMSVQQHCIGALGALIHREICKLGPAGANEFVLKCVHLADKKLDGTQGSRFQYRGLGAMIALQVVLQQIGIEIFPMKGLLEAFRNAHDAGQTYIAENTLPKDSLALLARVLHDKMSETLVTDKEEPLSRHRPDEQPNRMFNTNVPNTVSARHVRTTGLTYLSKPALKAWCALHGLGDQEIVKKARAEGVLIPFKQGERYVLSDNYNLYKGLRVEGGGIVHCYKLDCHKLAVLLGVEVGDVPGANVAPPPPSNVTHLRR